MKERTDLEEPVRGHRRYNFDRLRPGTSWHVDTNEERCRVMASFTYWAKNIKKIPARATSLKVDETDPDGPGFRIWFVSTRPKPMPVEQPPAQGDEI